MKYKILKLNNNMKSDDAIHVEIRFIYFLKWFIWLLISSQSSSRAIFKYLLMNNAYFYYISYYMEPKRLFVLS